MGEIYFVRHGQANSQHATDEASYDKLSELGHQQAAWLGDYFRSHEAPFDQVFSGTLKRQRQTAQAMGFAPDAQDVRLNEFDYYNLASAMAATTGHSAPAPEDFANHIHDLLAAWQRGDIQGNESFDSFAARVLEVLQEAQQPGRRVLCVTSGGVIGMVMRHLLALDTAQYARILLPILNTSVTRVAVRPHGAILAGFNSIAHLDPKERQASRTHF